MQWLQKKYVEHNYNGTGKVVIEKWAKTKTKIMTSLIILVDVCHWSDRYQWFVAGGIRTAHSYTHVSTIPRTISVKEIACRYNLIIVSTSNRVIYTESLEF